jgi:predicted Zn-dependent peptidase
LQIVKQQIEDMKNGKFDNTDLKNATELIISSFKSMQDEQDSEISYYFNKELNNEKISVDEYLEKVQKVTLEDIKEVAQNVKIDTIYFLTSEEQA